MRLRDINVMAMNEVTNTKDKRIRAIHVPESGNLLGQVPSAKSRGFSALFLVIRHSRFSARTQPDYDTFQRSCLMTKTAKSKQD